LEVYVQPNGPSLSRHQRKAIVAIAQDINRALKRAGILPGSAIITLVEPPQGGIVIELDAAKTNRLPPWLVLSSHWTTDNIAWLLKPNLAVKEELKSALQRLGWGCIWR
jgi:hypothetical protein